MSTTEQRIADLEARLAKVEASPKVSPYLSGAQWPARVTQDAGTVSTGYDEVKAFNLAHPKSKQLVEAEASAAATQVEFDAAQRAWFAASSTEQGGRYMNTDAYGGKVVEDVPADALITGRRDVPEYQTFDAAERKMIQARVRMYKLQRSRDLDRQSWEQKRNPSPNPPKNEKDSSWSSRIRMAPFGGEKRPASGLR